VSDREADISGCADHDPGYEYTVEDDCAHDPSDPDFVITAHPGLEFEQVYREHYAFVWRCARRMGVPVGDLDDVLQDTFVAAYRRFDSWDRRVRATTWLFGILRNVMRNRARGLRRHQRRMDAFARDRGAAPVEPGERMLAAELLRDFVGRLDEDKRAVFVLAELEGMTGNEIAEVLAINANTASSRLRAARQAFAEHFDQRDRRRVERAVRRAREQPEQPPRSAIERTLAGVLVGPAPVFGTAGAVGTGLGKLGLGSLFAAASVAVVASVGVPRLITSEQEPVKEVVSAASAPEVRDPPPRVASASPVPILDDEEPIAVVADSLARARPRLLAGPTRESSNDLAGWEALRAAREHLVEHRPEAALALLDAPEVDDPSLSESRAVTRIAALCQLDRADEAESVWATLQASSPTSPVVERLRDACWSKQ
jgi:RNA polymerase sigma factor (sigma-70 family)